MDQPLLSGSPPSATLSAPALIRFLCDLLVDPNAQEGRKQIADALAMIAVPADNYRIEEKSCSPGPDCEPFTSATDIREFFRRHHDELERLYFDKQIHIVTIRDFWEARNKLLPGDKAIVGTGKREHPRWWSQVGNALKNSDVFYKPPGTSRHWYVVRPIPPTLHDRHLTGISPALHRAPDP